MYARRLIVAVVTAAAGSATDLRQPAVVDRVAIDRYVKTDFADGSTFITAEQTGETLWTESNVNASATRARRQATHSTAGAAA